MDLPLFVSEQASLNPFVPSFTEIGAFQVLTAIIALLSWVWTAVLNNQRLHPLTQRSTSFRLLYRFMLAWLVLGIIILSGIPSTCYRHQKNTKERTLLVRPRSQYVTPI
ncbi:hypothetical protein DFH05DRAFT_1488675 [Lentinula detonsa]|uniref:Uncharacterized protein n=1 Tax=Lentinula detonsa TaxID=2804962 RepID=A0A9W8P2L7_9AGAR|nr:hypothetical protein DFH05DRAFT_1488675 [Lentinula detonsa]